MTATEIVAKLEQPGSASIKKVLLKHGIQEPLYGVKIEELKKIQKQVKEHHSLALELYATGIYDAMYLAGLTAEPGKMSKDELRTWALQANAPVLNECTVAWVAAESNHGMELAQEWIAQPDEAIAATGWATLNSIVAIKKDSELDITLLQQLLDRVVATIHSSPNRVKSAMNGFMIAVGTYVRELSDTAKKAAMQVDPVTIDVGDTACKVPFALDYIAKAEGKNAIGKKKKQARC